MPTWYSTARSITLFVVGVIMILHETFGRQPAGPLILAAGLLLMGFSTTDLASLWRGGNNSS
jgi:hypothetical protein